MPNPYHNANGRGGNRFLKEKYKNRIKTRKNQK